MRIEKRSLLAALIVLPLLFACAGQRGVDLGDLSDTGAQATVTTGTAETPASLDTNFTNIEANFTELYGKVVTSLGLSGTTLTITFDDATTVTADISGIQDGTGTDSQTITALSLDSETNILTVTISGGNTATVNLSGLASSGGIADAPSDGTTYGRNNAAWVQVSGSGAVDSVNAQTGDVVLDADDIADGATNAIVTLTQESNWDSLFSTYGSYGTMSALKTALGITLSDISDAGTAASVDTGTDIGDIPIIVDDGSGNPALNFAFWDASGLSGNLDSSYDTFQEIIDWLDSVNIGGTPEDTAYGATWDGDTDAASKNAIYDKIESISVGSPLVSAPTYSDESCTAGTYAYPAGGTPADKVECIATNTWDYLVVNGSSLEWAGWTALTPTPPTITAATVTGSSGNVLTLTGSEALYQGTGWDVSDLTATCSTAGAQTASYTSGDESDTHIFSLSPGLIESDDTCTYSWAGTTDGLEDSAGDDLAAISSASLDVTGSTYSGGASASFEYNVDHASGDNYAVVDAGTLQGTWSGTSGSAAPVADGLSIPITGTNQHIYFPITSSDIVNQGEYRIQLDVYVDAASFTDVNPLWEQSVDGAVNSTDYTYARINADGTVYLRYEGNNVVVSMDTTNTLTPQSWNTVLFRASVTNNIISVKINSNAWEDDADADTVTALNVTNNRIAFGEGAASSVTDDVYLDNVVMYNTYDAAWDGD